MAVMRVQGRVGRSTQGLEIVSQAIQDTVTFIVPIIKDKDIV